MATGEQGPLVRWLRGRAAELLAGGLVALTGVLTLVEAASYQMGTARVMGPGYFPFLLGLLLIALGLGLALLERPDREGGESALPALRPLIAMPAGILAFALTVERAGLAPAVLLVVFVASLSDRRMALTTRIVVAVATAIVSVLIFRVGLGLQFSVVRW